MPTGLSFPQAEWLDREIIARAGRYVAPDETNRFSLLTTVYERTDAALFAATAKCLVEQSCPFDEWIILAHGPITAALEAVLEGLVDDLRIHLLREVHNLGIMGGMRRCLEQANCTYVVPVDADDLLTQDALQIVAAVIAAAGQPGLVYSDEDMLIDGVPQAPYRRPDWDPVLNLASSYIWHLCAIRRDRAHDLGLYLDPEATWCHDWDTVFRFAAAGDVPVHVPEILYHWRQHPASSTHSADPDAGSRRSTHHLLQCFVAAQLHPEYYDIVDFPIFRGADEWYILRRPIDPPPVAGIALGSLAALTDAGPLANRFTLGITRPPSWLSRLFVRAAPPTLAALKQAIATVTEPTVLVLSDSVRPVGDGWWWEGVKLLELHPEVALVSGLLTDRSDQIVQGITYRDAAGQLTTPQRGHRATDAGPFAIWLKPQSMATVPSDLFFARTDFLRDALAPLPDHMPLKNLGQKLGDAARRRGMIAAYSPLIKAVISGTGADGK